MKTTKYVTQNELQEVFEILNGELWRKAYTDTKGRVYPAKIVKNKPNDGRGYCRVSYKNRDLRYHQIIWILINGDIPDGLVIDHIDGNKLNNDINNLRVLSQQNNSQNMVLHRQGKLLGTTFVQCRNKWKAQTTICGKRYHIGYYDTEYEAHYAYKNFLLERGVA